MSSKRSARPPRPHGAFLAGDVGELVGVSGTTIGQWARRGYVRASVSAGMPHVYSIEDVAEAAVVAELLRRGVRIFEVPVHYHARAHQEGKKLTTMDGVRVVRMLARRRLAPKPPQVENPPPGSLAPSPPIDIPMEPTTPPAQTTAT